MRRPLALLVVTALLASACGGGADGYVTGLEEIAAAQRTAAAQILPAAGTDDAPPTLPQVRALRGAPFKFAPRGSAL